jgi:hypothetical protein
MVARITWKRKKSVILFLDKYAGLWLMRKRKELNGSDEASHLVT